MFFSSDTRNVQIREGKINVVAVLSEMAKQGKGSQSMCLDHPPIREWECNKSALEETV